MKNVLEKLKISRPALTPQERERLKLRHTWDTLRANALSGSERTEIDAIFSRM